MFFYYFKSIIRNLRQPNFRLLFGLGLVFLSMILIFAVVLSTYEKNITFSEYINDNGIRVFLTRLMA